MHLEQAFERLEQVSERIVTRIARIDYPNSNTKIQYFRIFGKIFWAIKNLNASLDRAHRVVLVTSMERLEHVSGRIGGEITLIGC